MADEAMKIPLTKGRVALVDAEDYQTLSGFQWYYGPGYAVRNSPRNGGDRHTIRMHRVILDAPDGMEVDHINGDKLDNRRCNLRLATNEQNARNRRLNKNNTSGYKGAIWYSPRKKWRAQIRVSGRDISLGHFSDLILAAQVYNEAARQAFGEFALLNNI